MVNMKYLKLHANTPNVIPKLSFRNLIQVCDKNEQRLKKGEKIIPVEVIAKK
jgi:hypothetical protein